MRLAPMSDFKGFSLSGKDSTELSPEVMSLSKDIQINLIKRYLPGMDERTKISALITIDSLEHDVVFKAGRL